MKMTATISSYIHKHKDVKRKKEYFLRKKIINEYLHKIVYFVFRLCICRLLFIEPRNTTNENIWNYRYEDVKENE